MNVYSCFLSKMKPEKEAAVSLLLLGDPLQMVSKGIVLDVMYVIGDDGRRRKWFTGVVKKTRKLTQYVKQVCIEFEEDGSVVDDFNLHFDLYEQRKEAGWRIKSLS